MGIKAKLGLGIFVVLVVIASLVLLGAGGFWALSGLRAYVGAEGLWAKGQQEATYELVRYVLFEDEMRYRAFRHSLTVPLGDRDARLAMNSPDFNYEAAEQGFLRGGNHPDDIRALIYLYRIFRNYGHVALAVEQWELADEGITSLSALGEEIHTAVQTTGLDQQARLRYMVRIDELQDDLSSAETQFSYQISIASRQAIRVLLVIMVAVGILGGVICFFVLRWIRGLMDELASSESRFRRLAENAPDVIYRMTLPDGEYEYMSPAAKTVFGYAADDFYAQPRLIAEILHDDWLDFFAREWEKLIAGDMPPTYEYQIVHPTLGERWINQRNVLIRDGAGRPTAIEGVVTDVTERKDLEDEQERLTTELWHAHKMEAVGTLAGGIAHDFNNILASIMGNAELARMDAADGSSAAECLDEVLVASERARDLVRRILAFSRRDGQDSTVIDTPTIVEEAVKLMRATLPTTVEIVTQLPDRGCAVLADPTQIHQIVMNLCTNAAQALEPGGGRIGISVSEVELPTDERADQPGVAAGPQVLLEVSDTGPGIEPEVRDRIFEPYFTTKPTGQGTGMGLAVVHGIVVTSGGAITVDSGPDGGSVFRVYLPRVEAEAEVEDEEVVEPAQGREHILLVDDEPSLALLNQTQLSRSGFQVTAVTSSREALEKFRVEPDAFDLVVTDQTMPDLTGDELARELLRIRPELPIILCTGYSRTISEADALAIGIRAYLMKPLGRHDLVTGVREVLDA